MSEYDLEQLVEELEKQNTSLRAVLKRKDDALKAINEQIPDQPTLAMSHQIRELATQGLNAN